MKIAVKNKSEMKYIDSSQLQVGDITLEELCNKVNHQDEIIANLLDTMKDKHLVNKDTAYIVQVGNELKRVDQLVLVAVEELKYPLRYYEIVDGEIKLNKKKVAVL